MQFAPGSGESAHHGADRRLRDLRRLLVREPVNAHEADEHALFLGQVRHGRADCVEREPALHHPAAIGTGQRFRCLDVDLDAAHLLGAHAVEPEILGDTIHPAVEPRSWLPLVDPRQGTHTSLLDEIVALIEVSGQGHCEAPQTRQ